MPANDNDNDTDTTTRESRNWMQKAFSKNPGKLHRRLGVPVGQKIPQEKLAQAAKSSDPSMRKEAALAKTGKRYAGKIGPNTAVRMEKKTLVRKRGVKR